MDANILYRKLYPAGLSIGVYQKLQAVVNTHQLSIATGHNGQIIGRIADLSKLPIDKRKFPIIFYLIAQNILWQRPHLPHLV